MWLEQCPGEFKPDYYGRYMDGISALFKSQDHLTKFQDYLNKCHPSINSPVSKEECKIACFRCGSVM